MRHALILAAWLLSGCISVGVGGDVPARTQYLLHDSGAGPARRDSPLVPALLIQPLPASAMADTSAMAYSRRPHAFAFYQFATWAERPVRQLPRLLQTRLEARGLAGTVGLMGDPVRADWLLTLAVDEIHHDVGVEPGSARLTLTAELYDRRARQRVARRSFTADVATPRADAAAAAQAMSQAVAQNFDALLPWLEAELDAAPSAPAR